MMTNPCRFIFTDCHRENFCQDFAYALDRHVRRNAEPDCCRFEWAHIGESVTFELVLSRPLTTDHLRLACVSR